MRVGPARARAHGARAISSGGGRERRGTATVELVLVLPVLLMMILGVVDISRAIDTRARGDRAALAGARAGMDSTVADSSIRSRVLAVSGSVPPDAVTIQRGADSIVVQVSYTVNSYLPFARLLWDSGGISVGSSATALVVGR